jgi:nucleolar pre-ribosomal-associated protein 1
VDVHLLSDLIGAVLNEKFDKFSSEEMNSLIYLAEWRPLTTMLHFLRRISNQHTHSLFTTLSHSSEFGGNSLCSVSRKVEEMLNQEQTSSPDDVATAFLFSIICAPPKDIISDFPDLIDVLNTHFPSSLAFLSSVLFLHHDYLAKVASFWPDILFSSIRLFKDDMSADHVNTVGDKWQNLSVSTESAPLSTFLNFSPFCALLPSVLSLAFSVSDEIREAYKDALLRLLQVKLSECTFSELTLYLRVILFWSHHLLSSYTIESSNILEQLCNLCFSLVDGVFEHIQVLASDRQSKSAYIPYPVLHIQDIVDCVVHHPIIALSLSRSLSNCQNLSDGSLEHLEEALAVFTKENLHLLDHFVLKLLGKLYDLLLMVGSFEANYSRDIAPSHKSLFAAPNLLLENILLLFKEKFDLCMGKVNFGLLLPNFYMVCALTKFLSPVKLLDLANWMFTKLAGCSSSSPAFVPAALMCLYITDVAMEMLCRCLQKTVQRSESYLLWDLEIHVTTIKQAYHIVIHFATKWNLEFADHCLLKMLGRIHHTERCAGWSTDYIAFHMILSSLASNTPIDVLHHCIFPTSKVKAKALLLLLEASPMHMNLFRKIFLETFKKDNSVLGFKDSDSNASWPQEDGGILLLPAALSCLKCHSDDNGWCAEFLEPVSTYYSELLLCDKGFSSWKSFVTRSIFEEDFSDFIPTSVKDIMTYFSGTLLGKSVMMLHHYFTSKEMSMKQRLDIVGSIFPESSELLDSDVNNINPTSCKSIMKVTNELFARISLIRLLLSSPRKLLSSEVASERASKRLHKAKLNFISILVRTMDKIFMNLPSSDHISSHSTNEQRVIGFLEYVILKNIIELSSEIQSHLNQLKSIPFLSQFIRSTLLHRFNDPVAIKAIRSILVVLSQAKFSADEILELILGHSNFISTITCNEVSEYRSACNPSGGMLQPAPSILKLVDSSFMEENKPQLCTKEKRRVEIIRLLRVLYDIKSRQQNNSQRRESRELVFLLLSIYGATLSETDLEILHLMNEIESTECSTITEVDHLWGSAALKFREELKLDFSKSDTQNIENAEVTERRRALFRENIPVDSKLCAKTALLYCYKRSSRASAFSLEQLQREKFTDTFEVIFVK